ncbi:MAG: hypothetical protein E5W83_25635 [Mesorhizobium sp.]|nr:MAG: hypothetical protein E5W89_14435 [Mesorhizobium sp.]TJW41515.1 MAG: hypothetical protein E5W83_25635 [Mesorhizobium sp.]
MSHDLASRTSRRHRLSLAFDRVAVWKQDVLSKRRIVEESYVCGDSVSAVARRHGLFPAQLFAWRRAARESSFVVRRRRRERIC